MTSARRELMLSAVFLDFCTLLLATYIQLVKQTDLCWCHRCAIFSVLAELMLNCAPALWMVLQFQFGGSKCFVRAKSLALAPSPDPQPYPMMRIAYVSATNIPTLIFFVLYISQILRIRYLSVLVVDVLKYLSRVPSIATLQYRDEDRLSGATWRTFDFSADPPGILALMLLSTTIWAISIVLSQLPTLNHSANSTSSWL